MPTCAPLYLEVAFPVPVPVHPLPVRTCPAWTSLRHESSSVRLEAQWKAQRLIPAASDALREPARRATWRHRDVTMHTALWRTRSLLLPPLSKAWAVPRSPTWPPSPFVYTLTRPGCVSSCLVFINVLRAQTSRSHSVSSCIHPGQPCWHPLG